MNGWRPPALAAAVTVAGALATLGVEAAAGMRVGEVAHLALMLLPAVVATVVSTAAARPLLARATVRQRLLAIALVAVLVGLANLWVLSRLMVLDGRQAAQVAVLMVYSAGAGVGTALALSRSSAAAVDRLSETARALGRGDLDARAGRLDAGRELDELAATLDEMAERLQASIERERTAEAGRRDLVTAVSHDLRTPLASLRAMVEAVEDRVVEDPPSLRRYARGMRRAVGSLSALVDDLFELVQLDAGAIEAETERARLGDVVRSAVAACEGLAQEKGLLVETELRDAEEAPCSPRLGRVLNNLLQNAIRHTPADGTVRVEARRTPSRLEVAVEDSGEGISPESLGRVFEPFWRADAARSGGGSGLGLALAKRIVEAMGGRIHAASRPARGSRFAVVLPDGGNGPPRP